MRCVGEVTLFSLFSSRNINMPRSGDWEQQTFDACRRPPPHAPVPPLHSIRRSSIEILAHRGRMVADERAVNNAFKFSVMTY